jgi:L-ascorbate metabolism protein UlaG (beta-lactamase superfamily)
LNWRVITNLVKHRPEALRLADHLGRSRGRLRPFERLNPPPKPAHTPDLTNWSNHALAACWIGHATVLLRVAGLTILTDPVFSNRVGIGLGPFTGGPRRLLAPALSLRELPPIDLILISHAHFDHLDRPTLHRLPRTTPVITAHQTQDLIRDLGFNDVTELRWNESTTLGPLSVSAHPVAHWGARTFTDSHRGYNAYLLDSPTHRILYGGDSAYHDGLKELPRITTRNVDLAILGIGAYDPYVQAHATPEQALTMADHCRAERILPMHHSTFKLSHEPTNEPLERAFTAAGRNPGRLVAYEPGRLWTAN